MARKEWLTMFEVLEALDVPYAEVLEMVERGQVGTRQSGAAQLYDADDIAAAAPAVQRAPA